MRFLSTKRWVQLAIGIVLMLLFLWRPFANQLVHAQLDTSTSFRLSRIESDIRTLRSELQQLETALNRVQRSTGDRIIVHEVALDSSAGSQDDAIAPSQQQPLASPDPLNLETVQTELMFDQLATLVIETRQDMFVLQDKVEQLEQEHG